LLQNAITALNSYSATYSTGRQHFTNRKC